MKASTHDNLWKCGKCTNIQQSRMSESTNLVLPDSTNLLPSQPYVSTFSTVPTTSQNKLKFYQWNVEGIRPKLLELRHHFLKSEIDGNYGNYGKLIKLLSIEGYATIRKDRNNILRGGLLLFIGMDIVFKKLGYFKKAGMEILSIRIKATKSSWLDL